MHGGSSEGPAELQGLPLVLDVCAAQDPHGSSFHQLLGQVHDLVVVCISLRSQGLAAGTDAVRELAAWQPFCCTVLCVLQPRAAMFMQEPLSWQAV